TSRGKLGVPGRISASWPISKAVSPVVFGRKVAPARAGGMTASELAPSRQTPDIGLANRSGRRKLAATDEKGARRAPAEGMNVMRRLPRRHLFSVLLPATLLAASSGVAAQQSHGHDHEATAAAADAAPAAVRTVRWSDPSAWPEGQVPDEGDAVTIARGTEVVLDVSPPALRSLTVDGKLRFADDRDVSLATE